MCTPALTLGTGLRTTNPLGMLLDPLNLSGKFSPKKPPTLEATSAPDPEAERLAAEIAATQAANAKIVERQRRRRSQGGLTATLGTGADPLGAKTQPTGNPNAYQAVTGAPMGYVTAGRASGANTSNAGGSGYYGGYKPAKV